MKKVLIILIFTVFSCGENADDSSLLPDTDGDTKDNVEEEVFSDSDNDFDDYLDDDSNEEKVDEEYVPDVEHESFDEEQNDEETDSQLEDIDDDSPEGDYGYFDDGKYFVVSEMDNASFNYGILFHRPEKEGKYPVFMFNPGANGFGSDAIKIDTYDLFLKHLASYGFVVIVVDATEAGMPDGKKMKEVYGWYKNKLSDDSHWLSKYVDEDKFIVGGHSNGGTNSSALLVENIDEIEGIVFLDSFPSPGVIGLGAHDVSGFEGKVLSIVGSENDRAAQYKEGFEKFENAECKTFINVEGLGHAAFGDYEHSTQTVGEIGREKATIILRHFLLIWFLSEFHDDHNAAENLNKNYSEDIKDLVNTCG
jgi:pimeloyl-ACP methyl ester carboxylesterase